MPKLKSLGFLLWRDRTEMLAGDVWERQIQETIEASGTMVLCLLHRHSSRASLQLNGVMHGRLERGSFRL